MNSEEGDNVTDELPAVDTPPKNGVFVEHFDLVPTEEEIAKGNLLGAVIDVDDDKDNGLDK